MNSYKNNIHRLVLTLNKIYYKKKIGTDYIFFNNVKYKIYLTKKLLIVYINQNMKAEYQIQLKKILHEKYSRNVSLKKSMNGYIIPDGFSLTEKGIIAEIIKKDKDGEITVTYKLISDRWIFITSKIKSQYHNIFQFEVESIHPVNKKSVTELCNMDVLGKWNLCISFCMNNLAVSTSEIHKK
jgi:hypothetical protein